MEIERHADRGPQPIDCLERAAALNGADLFRIAQHTGAGADRALMHDAADMMFDGPSARVDVVGLDIPGAADLHAICEQVAARPGEDPELRFAGDRARSGRALSRGSS